MTDVRRCRSSSFVRHKVRQSYISKTVWPRIPKFYRNLQIDRVFNHTTLTASGGISQEHFKWGSRNFTWLSWTAPTNLPEMTSLAISVYCKMQLVLHKSVQKSGMAGIEAHNATTVWGKITTLNLTERRLNHPFQNCKPFWNRLNHYREMPPEHDRKFNKFMRFADDRK